MSCGEIFDSPSFPATLEELTTLVLILQSTVHLRVCQTIVQLCICPSSVHFCACGWAGAFQGESFYNPYIPATVEKLKTLGLLQESDGAQCIWVEGHKVPLIVVKSDGGYNYATTDLACIWYAPPNVSAGHSSITALLMAYAVCYVSLYAMCGCMLSACAWCYGIWGGPEGVADCSGE